MFVRTYVAWSGRKLVGPSLSLPRLSFPGIVVLHMYNRATSVNQFWTTPEQLTACLVSGALAIRLRSQQEQQRYKRIVAGYSFTAR